MKKLQKTSRLLYVLAAFAITFNVTYVVQHYLKYYAIAQHAHAEPRVRQTGYPVHREAIEKTKALTVLISNEGFGGVSRGTGIILDPTHILTCAHLIQSYEDDLWVYTNGGGLVKGKPVHGDRGADLAIVELSRAVKVPAVAKFAKIVNDGEPITIIGNALGAMRWFVSYGFVSGQVQHYVLTDGNVFHGDSGGPWINEAGEIVAISDFGLERDGIDLGVHGGVNTDTIRKFIDDWNKPAINFSVIISN